LVLALVGVGDFESGRALGEDIPPRCRRVLGPDHWVTLLATVGLVLALVGVGEVESGRALGEDVLPRCRRVLGPDHPITLYLIQAASIGSSC
jgi:hypothetical protein